MSETGAAMSQTGAAMSQTGAAMSRTADHPRRAKIICTIGPSTSGVERLTELIRAGMDVARLNFSHGSHEQHLENIKAIRSASQATGKPVAILQDLQGPKIRTGTLTGGEVQLEKGAELVLTTRSIGEGDARCVSTSYRHLPADCSPGDTILLDDGYLSLRVESVDGEDITTTVEKGGVLKNNKGIIVPGVAISAPAISEKDIADLRFGLEAGVDAVALSFVRSEQDVLDLRARMRDFGRVVPIIAKIERYEGLVDIEDIVSEAEGIMVARGDLGVEMPAEQVPVLQKDIIRRCNYYGRPVVTATQMLESMIQNARPTRAEASDVANAVLDGSDCLMLSGETSIGSHPLEAVGYMDRIIRTIEAQQLQKSVPRYDVPEDMQTNVADSIGHASCVVAAQIGAAAIVTLTSSGGTARVIAKYRPRVPILALTDRVETLQVLPFIWGVQPVLIRSLEELGYDLAALDRYVLESGIVSKGDHVVYSAGSPLRRRGSTNMLEVRRV